MSSYGEVYTGIDRETGNEVTWRVIQTEKLVDKEFNFWLNKLKHIEKLKHPHVVNCLSNELRPNNEVILIEEMMTAGTLRNFLKTFSNPKLRVCQHWFKQLLDGLQFLHSRNIVHGKLTCSHIYLNTNTGDVKIGDLTFAHLSSSAHWNRFTPRNDIRNFGVCLLEVAFTPLFTENDELKTDFKKLYEEDFDSTRKIQTELLKQIKSKKYKNLIELCLFSEDIDILTLKKHKFFTMNCEEYISNVLSRKALLHLNREYSFNNKTSKLLKKNCIDRTTSLIKNDKRKTITNANSHLLNIEIKQTIDNFEKTISFVFNTKKDTIIGITEEMKSMQILPEKYIWAVMLQLRKISNTLFYHLVADYKSRQQEECQVRFGTPPP